LNLETSAFGLVNDLVFGLREQIPPNFWLLFHFLFYS
jgi:hypothetical protein